MQQKTDEELLKFINRSMELWSGEIIQQGVKLVDLTEEIYKMTKNTIKAKEDINTLIAAKKTSKPLLTTCAFD